jgi:hypothetical protein
LVTSSNASTMFFTLDHDGTQMGMQAQPFLRKRKYGGLSSRSSTSALQEDAHDQRYHSNTNQ